MRVSRNIPILFAIKLCKWLMLYMPVVKLFYEENGLGNKLFLLHGIYSLIIALTEIPSGYIADRWGRKPSMQLGTLLGAIGFTVYSFSFSFEGFLLAQVALGLGQGFISGADSALLYETLLQQKKQKRYLHFEGRITSLGNVAEAAAGVIVSVLAFSVFRNYYHLQAIVALSGFLFSLFLIEPIHVKNVSIKARNYLSWKTYFSGNKKLTNYILISSIFGLASLSMAWFAQVIFFEIGLRKDWFGYGATILNLSVAIGSFFAGKIFERFNSKSLVLTLILIFSVSFLASGLYLNYYTLILILIFYLARGVVHPVMKQYINENCSTDIRATVLSFRSMIIRVGFFVIAPIFDYLCNNHSVQYALILSGLLIFIPGIILFSTIHGKR